LPVLPANCKHSAALAVYRSDSVMEALDAST
jgi:hypothetical protein